MVLLVPELLTGPIGMKSSPAGSASVASSSAASSSSASAPPALGTAQPAQGEPPLRTYTLTLGAATPAATPAPTADARQAGAAESHPSASSVQESAPGIPAKPAVASVRAPGQGQATQEAARLEPAPSKIPTVEPASRPVPARSPARHTAAGHPALQVAKPAAHQAVREGRSPASSRGWVVQLGVFADHRNAVRLAGMLQRRGFRIAVAPVRVRSRSLWRVITSPPQSRAAALHVAARWRAAGHRGDVLPAR